MLPNLAEKKPAPSQFLPTPSRWFCLLLLSAFVLSPGTPQQLPQIFAPEYDKVPKETQSSKKICRQDKKKPITTHLRVWGLFCFPPPFPVTIAISVWVSWGLQSSFPKPRKLQGVECFQGAEQMLGRGGQLRILQEQSPEWF